ncbi:MAG: hypothetical protein IT276_11940 [Ignavibacteriaceae bacterium]|nr:hypothetical protein [Ignavibacteriaceae bacterium]
MKKKNIVILLTSSISVKDIPFVKRNDYKKRKQDYIYSLNKLLKTTKLPIVFCENTGTLLDLQNQNSKNNKYDNLEIITFNDNEGAKTKGKGYSELKIIDYAIKNSKFITDESFIIKITGRYHVKNIDSYLLWLNSVELPFINLNFINFMKLSDSRFFGFKLDFFRSYLAKFGEEIDDFNNYFFEHALRDATLRSMLDGNLWLPLPFYPVIEGYSGTSNFKLTAPIYKNWKRKFYYKIFLKQL